MSEEVGIYGGRQSGHTFASSTGSGNPAAAARHDGETLSRDADISPLTPYYQDALCTIYHGDCRSVMPKLKGVGAIVCDPPYGTGYYDHDDDSSVVALLAAHDKKAVFGYPETLCRWCMKWGEPDEWITWHPTNKCGQRRKGKLPRSHEAIAVWGACDATMAMRQRSQDATAMAISVSRGLSSETAYMDDVWRDPSPGMGFNSHQRHHPNEKPLSLMMRLLQVTNYGAVCDPYMGSGTTVVAAKALGWNSIGIEIEERYCEIAATRLAQESLNFAGGDADFGVTDSNISSQAELLDSPNHVL